MNISDIKKLLGLVAPKLRKPRPAPAPIVKLCKTADDFTTCDRCGLRHVGWFMTALGPHNMTCAQAAGLRGPWQLDAETMRKLLEGGELDPEGVDS